MRIFFSELKVILSYQYSEMVLKQVERKMDFNYTTWKMMREKWTSITQLERWYINLEDSHMDVSAVAATSNDESTIEDADATI